MRQDAGYSEPFMRRAKDVQDAWKDHPLIGGSDGLNTGLYAEDEEEEDVALEPDTYDDDALLPDARPADEGDAVLVSGDDTRLQSDEPGGPSAQGSAEAIQEPLPASERNGHAELVLGIVYGSRLEELEATIRQNEPGFYAIADAFWEIKSKELYRQRGCGSFTVYIHRHWSGVASALTQGRISQLATAGKIRENITAVMKSTDVARPSLTSALGPSNEAQTRALNKAPDEKIPEVWQRAQQIATDEPPPKGKAAEFHKPGKVSTRHIELAIQQICPKALPPAPEKADTPEEDADIVTMNSGFVCPSIISMQYDWQNLTIWMKTLSGERKIWITSEELMKMLGGKS